ncbi:hypothetical protein WJX73_002726 [Symbiochloris irregularis]|uniref:Peroxiredoxin-like 2A n=1 Tax=Symbiochloris irregularis TaxID=706552 RepID=A0AAW1PU39_9CHLO
MNRPKQSPGCVLCRAEARRVNALRPALEKLGVKLVCLVHEWLKTEIGAFKPKFWSGELYLDKNKDMYRALGAGKVHKQSWIRFFCCCLCTLGPKYSEAKAIAPDSEPNVNGTHMVMGGYMVLKQGTKGVQWQFQEDFFGDHPAYDKLLEECQKAGSQKLTEQEGKQAKADREDEDS